MSCHVMSWHKAFVKCQISFSHHQQGRIDLSGPSLLQNHDLEMIYDDGEDY